MGQACVEWVDCAFVLPAEHGLFPLAADGESRRDFAICAIAGNSYLIHLPTGVSLAAFANHAAARAAADIVEAITGPQAEPDWALFVDRIIYAWQRAGFYTSGMLDARGNHVWALLAHIPQRGSGNA